MLPPLLPMLLVHVGLHDPSRIFGGAKREQQLFASHDGVRSFAQRAFDAFLIL